MHALSARSCVDIHVAAARTALTTNQVSARLTTSLIRQPGTGRRIAPPDRSKSSNASASNRSFPAKYASTTTRMMPHGVVLQHEQFLLRAESGRPVVLNREPGPPLEQGRPGVFDRNRHRVRERIAERGDIDPVAHARVAEPFVVGAKRVPVQHAVAHRRRNEAHADDVALPPLVDGVDPGAKTPAESERIFPPRIPLHFAEIVPLGPDASGHAIAQRPKAAFEEDERDCDAAGKREPPKPDHSIARVSRGRRCTSASRARERSRQQRREDHDMRLITEIAHELMGRSTSAIRG